MTKTQEKIIYQRTKRSVPSRLPQGSNLRQYDKDKHETQITKMIHKRSTALERSVRKLLQGLNMFDSTNLTLISDLDQDTHMFGLHERSLTYRCIIS